MADQILVHDIWHSTSVFAFYFMMCSIFYNFRVATIISMWRKFKQILLDRLKYKMSLKRQATIFFFSILFNTKSCTILTISHQIYRRKSKFIFTHAIYLNRSQKYVYIYIIICIHTQIHHFTFHFIILFHCYFVKHRQRTDCRSASQFMLSRWQRYRLWMFSFRRI